MGVILGEDNKLLFMRGDGAVFLVNGEQGQFEADEVWYSNTYSIEPPSPLQPDLFTRSAPYGARAWGGDFDDDRFAQTSRGEMVIRKPYADPLEDLDEVIEPYPSLAEMSETEIYHFVCGNSAEYVTDAILDLMCGR